jgi:signal transduction histidine kinase
MKPVPTGIGRRINLAISTAFAAVLTIGGVSVVLAWTISAGVEETRQRTIEVQAVDRIRSTVDDFLSDLHLVIQTGRAAGREPPEAVLDELKTRITAYETLERLQGGDEAAQELVQLEALKVLLAQLETVSLAAIGASERGRPPAPGELVLINELAHTRFSGVIQQLHAVHQTKFQRATERNQRRMVVISGLYVAFAFGGGLFLLAGNRFLSRSLVTPIARLADAALSIAGGDLSRRVGVRSGDEIGQLSRAFNLMAERLEAHERERLMFEAELGRQVKERTRDLEATTARLQVTQADLIRAERIAVTGQIAAGVTHEIRTPLNSLAINVQLLRRELSADTAPPSLPELLEALAALEYEITRINRILEEFVNFARLPTPQFEPVEIGPLLQEILALLGPPAAVIDVRVEPLRAGPRAWVRGDRDQLRQVFLNLGQNALQAMVHGGVLGVEIDVDEQWMQIAVVDSGPGVPETERERIFLPFVSSRADGLGLGLPIVRRIVEEHGGSVACHSGGCGGAVLVVRLPVDGAGREH